MKFAVLEMFNFMLTVACVAALREGGGDWGKRGKGEGERKEGRACKHDPGFFETPPD